MTTPAATVTSCERCGYQFTKPQTRNTCQSKQACDRRQAARPAVEVTAPFPVAGRVAYDGYTQAQLRAAFELVPTDPESWKMPISGHVPGSTDTRLMGAAITFYCGCVPEFTPQPDGSYLVEAPGYYLSVGA